MGRKQIINRDDLNWVHTEHGKRFAADRKQLGAASGGDQLGCSLIRLMPGKCAWPRHYHCANEESIYILLGRGTVHIGDEQFPVERGDYISFPAGPEYAHQLENTGAQPMEYLCMSTMNTTDVMGYPDSGKIGLVTGAAPGGDKDARAHYAFFHEGDDVPYWTGEE